MHESIEAGRPVELPEESTLANALAGGIGLDNRYSFDLIQQRVDQYLKVSEEQIADAIRFSLTHLNLVVEGGGAVALATLLNGSWTAPDTEGVVVVLLSGGNVATETLLTALSRE
jgi:threonine dehydratase